MIATSLLLALSGALAVGAWRPSAAAIESEQFIRRSLAGPGALSPGGALFDASQFKSAHEAIRAHPDLREFASLCEARGVKEIVGMDKAALTIFAPIDKSMGDLLAKSKARSINLVELAKHHIAHGLLPDDNTRFPFKFNSAALLSPLYLNQVPVVPATGRHQAQAAQQLFVNNARVLATYLIQIDSDNQFQTLHLIDQPLDFAYVSRRTQLRSQQASGALGPGASAGGGLAPLGGAGSAGGAGSGSGGAASLGPASGAASNRVATVKRALNLEDLLEAAPRGELGEQTSNAIQEFQERFGDLLANQPSVDLYHARALRNQTSGQWARVNLISQRDSTLAYNQAKLARLFKQDQQQQQLLRGRLYQQRPESGSLNTYFLPVNGDELDQLLQAAEGGAEAALNSVLALQAHIVPDQVLFTRTMTLGQLHQTLFSSAQQSVALSLAKTLPEGLGLEGDSSWQDQQAGDSGAELSRRLLATPLLLQAQCVPSARDAADQTRAPRFREGITSAEVLVANIPISGGVLHLIKRPLVVQSNSLLDFINDNEHQLSNIVQALGSQTGPSSVAAAAAAAEPRSAPIQAEPRPELSRFRQLLERGDRQLLPIVSDAFLHSNRTILAPTDQAFAKLRYDLRSLISGDELLVPAHWDPAYRQDLLERLLKRHIIADQTFASSAIGRASDSSLSGINLNGQLVSLRRRPAADEQADAADSLGPNDDEAASNAQTFRVECDSTQARLVHRDLIGTNGVLHLVDRVLGEDQETVHSLLESMVLRLSASGGQSSALGQLVEAGLSGQAATAEQSVEQPSSRGGELGQPEEQPGARAQGQRPELALIGKTIESFLNELSPARRQLLASSVNISFQLARLVSRAESRDDWNDKFRLNEKSFTYFVPTDLAWFKLQQAQPELHRPLMFFLEQQQQQPQQQTATAAAAAVAANSNNGGNQLGQAQDSNNYPDGSAAPAELSASLGARPRASESSHRLLQILERHLIASKGLAPDELNQLTSIQTLGATIKLVDQAQQLQLAPSGPQQASDSADVQPMSAFAALHSIIGGGGSGHSSSSASSPSSPGDYQQAIAAANQIKKALKFSSSQASILQAHETSNGFVYLIDNVLIHPDDAQYIVQTSSTPAISSTMSSLLGAHNSAILDFIQNFLSSSTTTVSANLMLSLIGTLTLAILVLAIVALMLVVRRRRQSKMNRHQQLESGLTSSSSANSGSTSTTKSL